MPSGYSAFGAASPQPRVVSNLRSVAFGVQFYLRVKKTERPGVGLSRGRWPVLRIVFGFLTRVLSTVRHRSRPHAWPRCHSRSHSDLTTITSINSAAAVDLNNLQDRQYLPSSDRRLPAISGGLESRSRTQQPLAVVWLDDRAKTTQMVEDHQHRQSVGGCRKESEVSRSGTELDDLADTKRRQKAAVVPYGVLKASWAAKTLTVALVLLFLAIAVFFWHKNRLIDEKLLQFYAANHSGRQSHPN